jgi:hypothetical protein
MVEKAGGEVARVLGGVTWFFYLISGCPLVQNPRRICSL